MTEADWLASELEKSARALCEFMGPDKSNQHTGAFDDCWTLRCQAVRAMIVHHKLQAVPR